MKTECDDDLSKYAKIYGVAANRKINELVAEAILQKDTRSTDLSDAEKSEVDAINSEISSISKEMAGIICSHDPEDVKRVAELTQRYHELIIRRLKIKGC